MAVGPGRPPTPVPWILAVILVMAAGCSEGRSAKVPVGPAWQAEGFEDLPLPELAGYRPKIGTTPIAASFAGGSLRRFDVLFVARAGEQGEEPQAACDRLSRTMSNLGWTRQAEPETAKSKDRSVPDARFRKGDEQARLSCRWSLDGTEVRLLVQAVRP